MCGVAGDIKGDIQGLRRLRGRVAGGDRERQAEPAGGATEQRGVAVDHEPGGEIRLIGADCGQCLQDDLGPDAAGVAHGDRDRECGVMHAPMGQRIGNGQGGMIMRWRHGMNCRPRTSRV